MKVVIYVESDVYPLDFAVPYQLFREAGAEVWLVSSQKGPLTTATGAQIFVKHDLLTLDDVDLLWVCAGFSSAQIIDRNTANWLNLMSHTSRYQVAVCNGVYHLIEAGILHDMPISLAERIPKKYKNAQLIQRHEPLLRVDNMMTLNSHAAVWPTALLMIEAICGPIILETVKRRHSISEFSKIERDERALHKYNKASAKYHKRYLKDIKAPNKAQLCVLYAYEGMTAVDFLVVDALASQMGYQIRRIADQRGCVETDDGGYGIVVDEAIQNHRQAQLLAIPGGQIDSHLVDEFLIHWLSAICPPSYRVLAVGNSAQLIGVTGLLREIDPDVLANLALGEGKYLLPQNFSEALRALLHIAKLEDDKRASQIEQFFGFGAIHQIVFDDPQS